MTTARPAPAHIDDYANPRFSPEVQAIHDAVAPMAAELRLEPEPLLEQARAETGLSHGLDDAGFRERLDVLLGGLRDEAGLSPFGVLSDHTLVLGLLRSRLLIRDVLERHPEILEIPITRPIVIVGLPRTGTSHLHNLISSDPALRSLPYWEALEPVLPASARPAPGEPDPRFANTKVALDMIDAAAPLFERMHEMTVEHVHEEIQLLAIDFSSMLFETMALMPTWRDYYLGHDQTPHYQYLKEVLQVLTWLRGGERWVLKSPQHCEQIRPLLNVFPDATLVVTHRDPVSVMASVVTMLTYAARMSVSHPDPYAYGPYWSQRVEDLLRACERDRDLIPRGQAVDVRFHEFMADDFAMVERIYEVAGQPMTAEARAGMNAFLDAHPRGKFGTVVYDLTDFGIDPSERRRALRSYAERFGTADESGRR
ncbi:MAG: sulfotransferase family protein [Acidimicrobiia bacterium]